MSSQPPPDPDRPSDWSTPGQIPGAQGGWAQQPGPAQPPATPYTPQAGYGSPPLANPFDGESTPILVTGILSIVFCGPVGVYAWVKGNDLRDRARAAGWPEPGSAKAGRILGIIGTLIFSAGFVFMLVWLALVLVVAGTAGAG